MSMITIQLGLAMASWDGTERRSGNDRRQTDRRRENTINIGLIVAGEASRRTGQERRKAERRNSDAPETDKGVSSVIVVPQ